MLLLKINAPTPIRRAETWPAPQPAPTNGIAARTAAAGRRFSAVSSALDLKAAEVAQTECAPQTILDHSRAAKAGDCPSRNAIAPAATAGVSRNMMSLPVRKQFDRLQSRISAVEQKLDGAENDHRVSGARVRIALSAVKTRPH
jgi:hypothetical protein